MHATKGEATTKALILADEGTAEESLDAVWMTTDTIYVFKGDTKVGELKPQEDNVAHAILKGEVSGVEVGDELTLEFLSPDYATQDGTLDYIAAHCDYATASVKVTNINGTDVTTTVADFENQQSIVKFTLHDDAGIAISATEMIVAANGRTYTIQPTASTGEVFVALPSFSEKDISMTATNGTDIYTFVRENATIERGKYYTLTMQMAKGNLVDLSKLTGHYVAQDGDVLMGATDNRYKISVADGASITLYKASINGTGSLTATGGGLAAGIGSGKNGSCGNISITGGTITAMGLSGGAGIGSGENGSCGSISITGGTITASGSRLAAGIGSGYEGGCGDIIINGTASGQAEGDSNSPWDIGPGGGQDSTCGTVSVQENTISGSYPN